jgi:hypothetical protein
LRLLAKLIAIEEGFFKPGTLPARNHNPGDLRHSPHSEHEPGNPNGIGIVDNDADGWSDLNRQLDRYAARGLTIGEAIGEYAPPNENATGVYLCNVCRGLRMPSTALVSDALKVSA